MVELSRRKLITGLVSLVAAPAIVRASSLMPVKAMVGDLTEEALLECMEQIAHHRITFWDLAVLKAEGEVVRYDPLQEVYFIGRKLGNAGNGT